MLWSVLAFSQKEDFNWIGGYVKVQGEDDRENFIMNFNNNQTKFIYKRMKLEFDATSSCISDSLGAFLLYANGCKVFNAKPELIDNGDTTTIFAYQDFCVDLGVYRTPDGAAILPAPGQPNQYYLFQIGNQYVYQPIFKAWIANFSYCKIDMAKNGGMGKVVEKDVSIVYDSLGAGQVEAVKHANGRDWWVTINRQMTNKWFIFLVDPSGINLHHIQQIGLPITEATVYSQSAFSPDGTRYIRSNYKDGVFLFDFDRAKGEFSNFKQFFIPQSCPSCWFEGWAFSPNSRYLYYADVLTLRQFDMEAADIAASNIVVAEYDGFKNGNTPSYFGMMQLGPDGKIYMSSNNGQRCIHVIEDPDQAGLLCKVNQHGIILPSPYFYTLFPNMPNFRLGPLDGSPADTLGLDNRPWAHWRWHSDTLAPKTVYFKDLSAYEPTNWHWDFGDSTESTDISPTHTYASAGTYNVCEIVWNQYAADTFCREVVVQTVSIPEVFTEKDIKTAPNPVIDEWRLYFTEPLEHETTLEFCDIGGRKVFSEKLTAGTVIGQVSLGGLPRGIYFWQLSQRGVLLKNGRVVKVE